MKTFVVLGMHRSATSLVAKGLRESGVFMGDRLLGADRWNKYGHYEDCEFVALNDEILRLAKGSWDNPPPEQSIIDVGDKFSSEIRGFVERKERSPLWGWKDPRTSLTVKVYLPYLKNPHFIPVFRDPVEVARSLGKRNGMTMKHGIILAKIYNSRIQEFLKEWLNGLYQ